ncbi:MAG: ABC transporter ATP-binding protein [Polyangiaceae bacterium]
MTEPLISIEGVSKEYASQGGVVYALRNVTLHIMPGEFVAIVGTSGSGKSTLMNILGCLDRPTHGTYTLGGIDVGGRTSDGRAVVRNRLIGFIFQGFNLLSRTTALENVELPLAYRGVSISERRRRAERALKEVGLGERMDHAPNQLSGGQQQRVAIARALVTEPPLLLADEPTGNLDTRTSLEVLSLLQRLNRERGITICLVTHEHDIAACASRVITVKDGRIVSDVRTERPVSATEELKALKLTDAADAPKTSALSDAHTPSKARKLPLSFDAFMFLGHLIGTLAATLYVKWAFSGGARWVPLIAAMLFESYFGARRAKGAFGRGLIHEERVRLALRYSSFMWGLYTLAFLVAPAKLVPAPFTKALVAASPAQLASWTLVAALFIVTTTLVRYALLALFGGSLLHGRRPPAPTGS